MSYIQSFRRYETKYLITEEQAEKLLCMAGDLLTPDHYGDYTICNLYLDTEDFCFIQRSLDRPKYKEKLRLRSYGNADGEQQVFLEIKKKYRGVVYKRRITLPCHEAMDYILNGVKPPSVNTPLTEQIFAEIDFLMRHYKPLPRVYLAYDRLAFYSKQYPQLRVTLDNNIRSRWTDISLASDSGVSYLDTGVSDYRLMEIKSDGAIPCELAAMLSELHIYPTSFSKYGNIYMNAVRSGKEILT